MLILQFIFTLPAMTSLFQTSNRDTTPIGVILILVLLVIALYWWGLNRPSYDQIGQNNEGHPTTDRHQTIDLTAHTDAVYESETSEETGVEPDDLKRIEGIGPKIEGSLQAAGIHTFAQLAASEVSQLEKIVREDAGIRIAFPKTWPQQAQLAATGQWEAFAKLQDELQGGRE